MRIIESMIRQKHLNSLPLLLDIADDSMKGEALQDAAGKSNEAMVKMILDKTPSEESLYEALKAGLRTAPLNLYENILAKIKKNFLTLSILQSFGSAKTSQTSSGHTKPLLDKNHSL